MRHLNLTLEDLLLNAIAAELKSKQLYERLAERVRNFLLRDRLKFLASEEDKHKEFLETIFRNSCPGCPLVIPETLSVPIPQVKCDESTPVSELLTSAMEAEKATCDFYTDLVPLLPPKDEIRKLVNYLARVELSHYNLLRSERDCVDDLEQADNVWPMFHIGP